MHHAVLAYVDSDDWAYRFAPLTEHTRVELATPLPPPPKPAAAEAAAEETVANIRVPAEERGVLGGLGACRLASGQNMVTQWSFSTIGEVMGSAQVSARRLCISEADGRCEVIHIRHKCQIVKCMNIS